MIFCARTRGDDGKERLLGDHLRAVASGAAFFAHAASGGKEGFVEAARWAGLLHDLGKYSREFQERLDALEQGRQPCPVRHAYVGALAAWAARAPDVAFAVYGHHSGLPCPARLGEVRAASAYDARRIAETAATEDGLYHIPTGIPPSVGLRASDPATDLRIRMLLSCLVDADRLDAAGEPVRPRAMLRPAEMLARIREHVGALGKSSAASTAVLDARKSVMAACLDAAARSERLYSLTVPTGGGKTLASMAFALRRAELKSDEVRRVIVVIPYLSIIEQNAEVYADVFGTENVVEHHSGDFASRERADDDEDATDRDLTVENWDAPVVVTTSARFFDGLFSNRPSDLRRLHNIARSVVILDEVQTLPRHRLAPILSMVKGLSDGWGTTFLFCTATQPAFEASGDDPPRDRRWKPGTVREVMPAPRGLFETLRRVSVEWPASGCKRSWDDLADALSSRRRVLCVVNTKRHARKLYERLLTRLGSEEQRGVFHLSTRMCPGHRLDVIRRVHDIVADPEKRCIVVSTQLVEAGVDLDFPVVFRAMGPLDSVAQAAGRCNREGRAATGEVIVFEPEDDNCPPGAYKEARDVTRRRALQGAAAIDDPEIVHDYFDELYGDADQDQASIEGLRKKLDFPKAAEEFRLIDDATVGVIVLYGKGKSLVERLRGNPHLTRDLARKLQPYKVALRPSEFEEARRNGAVAEISPASDLWRCAEGAYSQALGLLTAPDEGRFVV